MGKLKSILVIFGLIGILFALFTLACSQGEPKASPASIVKGGLVYDKWWKAVEGAAEPKGNHPLWALQTTNTRTGLDTWRCKECHGWDYKGKDGAYGKGSHLTGFPGVYNAALNKTKAELSDILKGKPESRHNFASVLSEAALGDLVNFLKEGIVDEAKYVDYATKKSLGADVARGRDKYSTCSPCHGADGKQILFDGKDTLGFLATDNPWESLHKIRFGHPGAAMPASVTSGWSTEDAVNVLAYCQTLPTK